MVYIFAETGSLVMVGCSLVEINMICKVLKMAM